MRVEYISSRNGGQVIKLMLANNIRNACFKLAQQQSRAMSTAVYLWTSSTRLGSKSGSAAVKYEMPKGMPKRIEAFDDLDVKELRIGLRHSAVVTKKGELYTFG